jgi:hypothetical protein
METEKFDQYFRTQFENETVAPPAALEEAVFDSLAAGAKKRRGAAAVTLGLVVTAAAAALWMNAPAPAQPEGQEPLPNEAFVPATSEPASAIEKSAPATVAAAQVPAGSIVAAPSEMPAPTTVLSTEPEAMNEVNSRALSGVKLQDSAQPELQQLQGEKWVLPATVKVND